MSVDERISHSFVETVCDDWDQSVNRVDLLRVIHVGVRLQNVHHVIKDVIAEHLPGVFEFLQVIAGVPLDGFMLLASCLSDDMR